jgi:hypothetical protein
MIDETLRNKFGTTFLFIHLYILGIFLLLLPLREQHISSNKVHHTWWYAIAAFCALFVAPIIVSSSPNGWSFTPEGTSNLRTHTHGWIDDDDDSDDDDVKFGVGVYYFYECIEKVASGKASANARSTASTLQGFLLPTATDITPWYFVAALIISM